jgi:hypothetical protein
MHFDNVSIGIVQKDLVPVGNRPNAVIGILDAKFIKPLFEAFDIIGTKAEMPAIQRVDVLLHFEAKIYVARGEVEFDGAIGDEIYLRTITVIGVHACVLFVLDPVHRENGLVELGKARDVLGAQVHMVILEFHSVKALLDDGMMLLQCLRPPGHICQSIYTHCLAYMDKHT